MPRVSTIEVTTSLELLVCGAAGCGISFAVPDWWADNRRRDHTTWYCPNGHPRAWLGKNEEEKLREQLRQAEQDRDWQRAMRERAEDDAMTLANQRRALRGVVTKLKRKAASGECAFCHQKFADVAEHVAAEHPGVSVEAEDADESEAPG